MKIWTIINKRLEEYMLIFSLSFIVILVIAQVISRHVINFPMGWSSELSRYILIWIAWISASYAVQKKTHIRVKFFRDKLKGNFKKALELFVMLLWFTFALFLAIAGTQFVLSIGKIDQLSPSLEAPMWIVYLGVPIAGALMSIRLIQRIIIIFKEDVDCI